jgi:hypothetical protein
MIMTSSKKITVTMSERGRPVASSSSRSSIGVVMTQSMYRTYCSRQREYLTTRRQRVDSPKSDGIHRQEIPCDRTQWR